MPAGSAGSAAIARQDADFSQSPEADSVVNIASFGMASVERRVEAADGRVRIERQTVSYEVDGYIHEDVSSDDDTDDSEMDEYDEEEMYQEQLRNTLYKSLYVLVPLIAMSMGRQFGKVGTR